MASKIWSFVKKALIPTSPTLHVPEIEQPSAAVVQPTSEEQVPMLFPPGHFYSPISDPKDLFNRKSFLWNNPAEIIGLDFNVSQQLSLIEKLLPFTSDLDFTNEAPETGQRYFYSNDQFPALDAEFLFLMLRHFRPARFIEVGSGYSTLVTAEVNRRYFDLQMQFDCVEPYPRQFLIDGIPGVNNLIVKKVEDIAVDYFQQLGTGDVLFIDSSHVSKIGSDVNHLFLEVLPRLRAGVIVHIHDIFLPDEYPAVWMIDQGRNWNEQYLLRALLIDNPKWSILWASHFMGTRHRVAVQRTFPGYPSLGGGGSFWIQKVLD
jgi:predicted O-methyltransferase YrrM